MFRTFDFASVHHSRRMGFIIWALVLMAFGSACSAQQSAPGTLHVVRAGFGNVEGMKRDIRMSEDACRVAKKMPPGEAVLPSDATLAALRVMEQEEFFDGQFYASYETQRQVGADAANGCNPALFVQRHATVDRTCASRVRGGTALLGQLMDFETVTPDKPDIFEESLSALPCAKPVRPDDLEGLPREDAGGARCVWASAILARQMAKIGMATGGGADKGSDICYYEAMPKYYYQGYARPVILMSRKPADRMDEFVGVASAFGNLRLQKFAAGGAIDRARFSRTSVDSFLAQPTKTTAGI